MYLHSKLTYPVTFVHSSNTLEYLLYSVSEKKYNYFNADFVYCRQYQKHILSQIRPLLQYARIFFFSFVFYDFFFFSQWNIPLKRAISKVLHHLIHTRRAYQNNYKVMYIDMVGFSSLLCHFYL